MRPESLKNASVGTGDKMFGLMTAWADCNPCGCRLKTLALSVLLSKCY